MRNFILHSLLGVILIALSSCGPQALEQVSFASAEDPFRESLPEVQTWEVDASADKLLTGSAGTQLLLPAGSLLDANGDPATGKVKVELSEALNLDEMLFANLTTTSSDQPLATGGMLFWNATSAKGEQLQVNPDQLPCISLPTALKLPGMMAYEGSRSQEGKMEWSNPQPLIDLLEPVPFDQLDFYPPGFKTGVESVLPYRGHTQASKELLDSLYYFGSRLNPDSLLYEYGHNEIFDLFLTGFNIAELMLIGTTTPDQKEPIELKWEWPVEEGCGISPLAIKDLCRPENQGTFLATRAFEARMPFIHQSKSPEVLRKYTNGTDRPLWEIDQEVAKSLEAPELKAQFQKFADEKIGKAGEFVHYQELITEPEPTSSEKEDIESTTDSSRTTPTTDPTNSPISAPSLRYTFTPEKMGWWNIDLPLAPDVPNMITLSPNQAKVSITGEYDRVNCYLVVPYPSSVYHLDTKVGQAWTNGQLAIPLEAGKQFPVFAIGWKGDDRYWGQGQIGSQNFTSKIQLAQTAPEMLSQRLKALQQDGLNEYYQEKIINHQQSITDDLVKKARNDATRLLWEFYYLANYGCEKPGMGRELFVTSCRTCHSICEDQELAYGSTGPKLIGVTHRRDKEWLHNWMMIDTSKLEDDPYFEQRDAIAAQIHPGQSSSDCIPLIKGQTRETEAIIEYIRSFGTRCN